MQQSIVNKWLKNSYNGHINQEIIVFVIQQNNSLYYSNELRRIASTYVNLIMLEEVGEYRYFKNSIVVTNGVEYQSFKAMKKILLKNVILVYDEQSIVKIIELLKTKTLDTENQIQYTLLSRMNLEEILDRNAQDLTEFIKLRSHLMQKLNSHLQAIDPNLINHFLAIYEHKNILLASFAQALYQLSSLNFIANQKVIGGELHKVLGRASKVISYKSLRMELPMELRKNIRVYDLNTNEIESETKIGIAKKLLLLENKSLDVTRIAKIVGLPQKQIEKIFAKNVLK